MTKKIANIADIGSMSETEIEKSAKSTKNRKSTNAKSTKSKKTRLSMDNRECPVCLNRYFRQRTYVERGNIRRVFAHWVSGHVKVCINDSEYETSSKRRNSRNERFDIAHEFEPVKRKNVEPEEFDRIFC